MNNNDQAPSLDQLITAMDVLRWFAEQLPTAEKEPEEAAKYALLTSIVNLTISSYAQAIKKGASHQAALLTAVRLEPVIPPHMSTSVGLQLMIATNTELREPPAA